MADGVGGWLSEGIDPSYFSKVLMESCSRACTRESADLSDPVRVLNRGYKDVLGLHSKCYGETQHKHVVCDASLLGGGGRRYNCAPKLLVNFDEIH